MQTIKNQRKYDFHGSVSDTDPKMRVSSYSFKVGSNYVFSEDVQETEINHVSLKHYRDAHYLPGKKTPHICFGRRLSFLTTPQSFSRITSAKRIYWWPTSRTIQKQTKERFEVSAHNNRYLPFSNSRRLLQAVYPTKTTPSVDTRA